MPDTQPKHKRVLHDSTPAGLPRWLRAADNAVRKPKSAGAKLYYRRVANAQRIREEFGDGGPVVFFKTEGYRDRGDGSWYARVTETRDAVACGNFCAAMHVQKNYLTEFRTVREGTYRERHWRTGEMREYPRFVRYEVKVTVDEIESFMQNDERTNLLGLTDIKLRRPVRCVICWSPVKN